MVGCSGGDGDTQPSAEDGGVEIYVVNYPLQYFAQRIVGDKAAVVFPAPPGGDPAFWLPDERAIAAYQEADLILLNGASYAKWVPMATLPESKMVNTSAGFQKKYLPIEGAITHTHGPEGEHEHSDVDFHTWLDPELAIMQAESIAEAVGELMPVHNDTFQQNLAALRTDLEELDAALVAVASRDADRPVLASHPVYGYLARRYGWNLKSMHWEPDAMPDDEQWDRLDALLAEHPAKWMVWEQEPDVAVAEKLVARGINVAVFSPCGNVPAGKNYLQVMRANIANLKPVFETLPAVDGGSPLP
jgi:zinc transport system substrate-binding protein